MSKIVSILGSTGSIGTQSLKVCEKLGYRLYALTAHANWQLMEQQIRQFHPGGCGDDRSAGSAETAAGGGGLLHRCSVRDAIGGGGCPNTHSRMWSSMR